MSRAERVGELLKEEISRILLKKVSDPRIGFSSVTNVDVSPDLKSAKVFVSVYGTEKDKKETMRGLQSAKGFIQGEAGRALELRHTPALSFILDTSIEKGSRVLVIMSKLEREAAESRQLSKNKKKR